MNKLALGTAQFGMNYGIANKFGKVSLLEVKKIIQLAKKNKIDLVDTAISYNESEKILGKVGVDNFKIISKLPNIKKGNFFVDRWLESQLENSLKYLGVNKLYGLLLHQPKDLLGNLGKKLINKLNKFRNNGLVNKIGISIYDPSEFYEVKNLIKIDIIQAPLNVIDRRLVTSGCLSQ